MVYKIAFLGTSNFACPSIGMLHKYHKIVCVVTSPSVPNRKQRSPHNKISPVKEAAQELGIKTFEPSDPKSADFLKKLASTAPDLICLAAYGHILSPEVLNVPKLAAINLHPSLLPKYRGAAPIQWAIINGEKRTGVTTFLMDEKVDHGHILLQRTADIGEFETCGTLESKLARIGAELLLETVDRFTELKPIPQPAAGASRAPKISKELRKIDWNKTALEIVNLIKALSPKPLAYTIFRSKRLEILSAVTVAYPGEPGRIEKARDTLWVGASTDCVELQLVKPEAKKEQIGYDFIHGYDPQVGEIMG